ISVGNIFIHLIQYIIRRFFIMETNTQKNQEGKMVKVSCSGGEGGDGHPKIYLTIGANKQTISCPYCGKVFKKSSLS
ncbi:MAG: hypothetical protein CFH33_01565, partial [Alphaproteobacteria bacterium MarineAlpha9_Bin3]